MGFDGGTGFVFVKWRRGFGAGCIIIYING